MEKLRPATRRSLQVGDKEKRGVARRFWLVPRNHSRTAAGLPDSIVWRHAEYRPAQQWEVSDRKSTRLNSSHMSISYAVFCLKKKKKKTKKNTNKKKKHKKTYNYKI